MLLKCFIPNEPRVWKVFPFCCKEMPPALPTNSILSLDYLGIFFSRIPSPIYLASPSSLTHLEGGGELASHLDNLLSVSSKIDKINHFHHVLAATIFFCSSPQPHAASFLTSTPISWSWPTLLLTKPPAHLVWKVTFRSLMMSFSEKNCKQSNR